MIKVGSLFDGIGGWLIAAQRCGAMPVWASEIDDFPMTVTKKHFPMVRHLGDVREIGGGEVEPVDIITMGSPCQDLSIAGTKKGLAGERSGIFMEGIRIANEMRSKTNGEYPKYVIWENVTGAFSSNKRMDFKAVLEAFTETEVSIPKSGKWAKAGMVRSRKCDVSWRVLDAQYWGVPQRRKRIFLIADFTKSMRDIGEILFVPKSLCGNSAQSQCEGDNSSGNTEKCTGTASERIVPTITASDYKSIGTRNCDFPKMEKLILEPFDVRLSSLNTNKAGARYNVYPTETSRTLSCRPDDPNANQGGVAIVETENHNTL